MDNNLKKREQVKEYLKRNKTKILVVIGFATFLIVVGVIIDSRKNELDDSLRGPSPTPGTSLIEQGYDYLPQPEVFPNSNTVPNAGLTSAFTLFFDEEVIKNSIIIKSNPQMRFNVVVHDNDRSKVILEPTSDWIENTKYEINILKGIVSVSGLRTKDDTKIQFTSVAADNPDYSGGGQDNNHKGI